MSSIMYACSVGIGCHHSNTRTHAKKAFVFDGFEREILAKIFLDRFTQFIKEFITHNNEDNIVPAEIWMDNSLQKVFHPVLLKDEIASVTVTDVPVIAIVPSNNFPALLQGMLHYFGIKVSYY